MIAFGAETGGIDDLPPSTARLEAEAAFATRPAASTLHSQPQITVRRSRVAMRPQPVAPGDMPFESKPANKGPRVFRVDAVQTVATGLEALAEASVDAPYVDLGRTAPPPQRRRRAADNRPGPVVHLFQRLPTRAEDKPTTLQLRELAAALARIDPDLRAIERAQSFVFVDDRFASAWQALSDRASALLDELRAPRTPPRRGSKAHMRRPRVNRTVVS